MLDDVLNKEATLLATLVTIRKLTIDHNIFVLEPLLGQLDKLIKQSEFVVNELNLMKEQDNGTTN